MFLSSLIDATYSIDHEIVQLQVEAMRTGKPGYKILEPAIQGRDFTQISEDDLTDLVTKLFNLVKKDDNNTWSVGDWGNKLIENMFPLTSLENDERSQRLSIIDQEMIMHQSNESEQEILNKGIARIARINCEEEVARDLLSTQFHLP